MEENKKNKDKSLNSNGTAKGFAIILAIIVALLGAYASNSVQLQSNQIDTLKERMVELTHRFEKHCDFADIKYENTRDMLTDSAKSIAEVNEKFKEVETQFRSQKEMSRVEFDVVTNELNKSEIWQQGHDARVIGLNCAQWERIKALERAVYGKSLPITTGEAEGAKSDY